LYVRADLTSSFGEEDMRLRDGDLAWFQGSGLTGELRGREAGLLAVIVKSLGRREPAEPPELSALRGG
jgi:hypothetical protein